MPEAPEVETMRRGLAAVALQRDMVAPTVGPSRVFREMDSPQLLVSLLTGARFSAIRRHGKFLILDIAADPESTQGLVLIMHMGMSGQLRMGAQGAAAAPSSKHSHFVLRFADSSEIAFIDPRTFGRVYIDRQESGESLPVSLAHLGPDVLGASDRFVKLREVAPRSRVWIKKLLLDQTLVAGIGNMYADEILFGAQIDPRREGRSLSWGDFDTLDKVSEGVLSRAVVMGGSSLADRSYRDIQGGLGGFQSEHRAYGRESQPCLVCGNEIARITFGGRSSYFCPRCQK